MFAGRAFTLVIPTTVVSRGSGVSNQIDCATLDVSGITDGIDKAHYSVIRY